MEEKIKKKYVCECGNIYESEFNYKKHYASCIDWWRKNRTEQEYLAWRKKVSVTISTQKQKIREEKLLVWISEKHTCEKCGKVMTEKFGSGRFCSRSCANSHVQNEEVNLKRHDTVTSYVKVHPEWYGLHGKAPNENQLPFFSSRAERELRKNLRELLPQYEFTTGNFVKYANVMLNPDIYSRKYKIVIEYDGDWHFVDIRNQLEYKQTKDRLLYKFILNSDFRLIRIDEQYKFTLDEIIKYITEDTRKIILLGDRYDYLFKE